MPRTDCLLKPVRLVHDPKRRNGFLVMCEVLNPDGDPHISNMRATFEDDPELWLGFEQEYTIMRDDRPLGFPAGGFPGPQGPYYCSVGADGCVGRDCVGRDIVEEHLDSCLDAGLQVTGINAECG